MKNQKGAVYIVHAVDTEGPLYEGLEKCFSRINSLFGINLSPSLENLEKLKKGELELNGIEDEVSSFVKRSLYKESWADIDAMHEVFMSKKWRARAKDSLGKPYVASWFCMDHVGFNYNPRRRATGYHEIYKYYDSKIKEYDLKRDRIYWHYHPMSFSHHAHRMGYNYSYSGNLHNEILSRRIIDKNWFPVANRPGGHIETYDINAWLEQWIPFDLANQSVLENPTSYKSMLFDRHGDWRGGFPDWIIYHPSLYDYRKKGELKRWISRCLNIGGRYSSIELKDIENAFEAANSGKKVLLSYTNHDFRDMVSETEGIIRNISNVAKKFSGVDFYWANAVEGFRAVLDMEKEKPVELDINVNSKFINIKVKSGNVWGVQPFLAIKTKDNRYLHDNLIINPDQTWTYCFLKESVEFDDISNIGIACNDTQGNTFVYNIDTNNMKSVINKYNCDDWM